MINILDIYENIVNIYKNESKIMYCNIQLNNKIVYHFLINFIFIFIFK